MDIWFPSKISNYNNSTILENLVSAGLRFEEV